MNMSKTKKKKDVREMILHKPFPAFLKALPNVELDDGLDFYTLISTINYAEYYKQHGKRKLAEHLVRILSTLFNVPDWYFTIVGDGDIKSKPLSELDLYVNRESLVSLAELFPINFTISRTKLGETVLYISISRNWETEIGEKMKKVILDHTFF